MHSKFTVPTLLYYSPFSFRGSQGRLQQLMISCMDFLLRFLRRDSDYKKEPSSGVFSTTLTSKRRNPVLGDSSFRERKSLCSGLNWFRSIIGDKMVSQDFQVDLNKALVFQVGHLGEAYQQWVHQPIVCTGSPRFFDNEIFEFLTRTVWWAVPTIWLPVVCYLISMSVRMGHSFPGIILTVLLGIFMWTLLEYVIHRFLFHIETKSYWGNTMHYFLHGFHHKHPPDKLRIVFPPALAAIFSLLFWIMVRLLSPPSVAPALLGGILLGYITYDVTHYYLHHGKPSKPLTQGLKRYHLNHHFRNQSKGFGVTSSLWDNVFGTLLSSTKASEEMNNK